MVAGGKHCLSLVMHRFCSNGTLCSASLSFMFIFLLISHDTRDCYHYYTRSLSVTSLIH